MASKIIGGTATPANVLAGTTFSAGTNDNAPGTMPNNGAPTLQPGDSITAGYYSGGSAASPGSGSQSWTTPGTFTFTVPSGVTRLFVELIGGGAGGGMASGSVLAAGGAGGQYIAGMIDVTPGETISGTVGAGGAAITAQNADVTGNNGEDSTFGSLRAHGGNGAIYAQSAIPGGLVPVTAYKSYTSAGQSIYPYYATGTALPYPNGTPTNSNMTLNYYVFVTEVNGEAVNKTALEATSGADLYAVQAGETMAGTFLVDTQVVVDTLGIIIQNPNAAQDVTLTIWDNSGTVLGSGVASVPLDSSNIATTINLSSPISLQPNTTYWIGIYAQSAQLSVVYNAVSYTSFITTIPYATATLFAAVGGYGLYYGSSTDTQGGGSGGSTGVGNPSNDSVSYPAQTSAPAGGGTGLVGGTGSSALNVAPTGYGAGGWGGDASNSSGAGSDGAIKVYW